MAELKQTSLLAHNHCKQLLLVSGFSFIFVLIGACLLPSRHPTPLTSARLLDPYVIYHLEDKTICDRRRYPATESLLEDRMSILVNGFSEARIPLLKQNMFVFSQSPVVEAIYVLWGNVSTPAWLLGDQWQSAGAPIYVIRQETNSLNDRFLPREFIRTKVVMICDDDITVNGQSLAFALQVWQENQHRIVGFFARAHMYNTEQNAWKYLRLPDRYSIILTKVMLIRTEYLFLYTCHGPLGMKDFVDQGMNCEDIAMNFLVASETNLGPQLVEGYPQDWGDGRNSDTDLANVGLSSRKGHRQERGECLMALTDIFGGMALRYSFSKASADVEEQVFCNKFGLTVHCDKKVANQLQAQRAVAENVICSKESYAYATLIDSEALTPAALVLAQSLRSTGTIHHLVLMIAATSEVKLKDPVLLAHFDMLVKVKSISNEYKVKGFNKLNAWLLEDYDKVVYIDVDAMVLTNLDHLFVHPEPAAVPDVYMSAKFNSGLLVVKPSKATFDDMMANIDVLPSYNRGDQGFLNSYFRGWYEMPAAHRLPARYNALFFFPGHYYPPAWYDMNKIYEAIGPIAVVHFAGPWQKPWTTKANGSDIVWFDIWLKVFEALKANDWMPLETQTFSLQKLLPNPRAYERFPQAFLAPVPLGSKTNKKAPNQPVVLQPATKGREGFVTVLWDDSYMTPAVWAKSYQEHHGFKSMRKTLLLVLSTLDREKWRPYIRLFNRVEVVDPIAIQGKNLHPEFAVLNVWRYNFRFNKLVYVHPLSLFTDNCNDLFRFEPFAAIPSAFPPDMFSSRVMVIQPDEVVFQDMLVKLSVYKYPETSLDLFLNAYFFNWFSEPPPHRLPISYGVDMWFKEGLMKFFKPWKILTFDSRFGPWKNISEWKARDRIDAAKLWRQTFCSVEPRLASGSEKMCEKVGL